MLPLSPKSQSADQPDTQGNGGSHRTDGKCLPRIQAMTNQGPEQPANPEQSSRDDASTDDALAPDKGCSSSGLHLLPLLSFECIHRRGMFVILIRLKVRNSMMSTTASIKTSMVPTSVKPATIETAMMRTASIVMMVRVMM